MGNEKFNKNRKRGSKAIPRRDRNDEGNRYNKSEGRNDVSWYSRNPNLLIAAGSFPFPYRPGMKLNLGQGTNSVGNKTFQREVTIPGVMVLDWLPTVGNSSLATDPASVLGKEMYAKVRKAYAGSIDADGPDFVMYVLSLDSIYSYIAYLKRLYRVLNAWSPNNYVTPDWLLRAMGLSEASITTLRSERMRLWQYINELVLQSRKFTCPAEFDIINRHYWMSDNVYTDDNTINSQFYMFNLYGVYKFGMVNMPDGNPGPGLTTEKLPTSVGLNEVTAAKLYEFGLGLINALVAWDDAYVINGYLMRAYEGSQLFMVDELPQDQPFTPVYEPEVLMQIENSRTVVNTEVLGSLGALTVSQNVPTNAVISSLRIQDTQDPSLVYADKLYTIPPWISVRSDSPTVADTVVATRLQGIVTDVKVANSVYTVTFDAATEIPLRWRILNATSYRVFNQVSSIFANSADGQHIADPQKYMNATKFLLGVLDVEQFDWHPFMWICYDDGGNWGRTALVGDVHNITLISNDDLINLHRICQFSEFNSFSQ